MRAGPSSNQNRQDFSLKRSLIRLNRDLENVIFRIDGRPYSRIWSDHSHATHLDCLSNLQKAILFLEDRRFMVHRGFEMRAPLRILKRTIRRKRAGGISTIDQQIVRICTGRYERTIRRKVRETLLAFLLNSHHSKASIFYAYLHESYFGYRLEGCEITSKFIFSKRATDLSTEEACFIAALLARPLPKVVFQRIEKDKYFIDIDPEYIINLGKLEGLDWSHSVQLRYQYVLRMFPSIPNSLRTR